MNSKIGIVIEREYRTRVCTKSFILLTLLMPLLIVGISILPGLLMETSKDQQVIAVMDGTGKYSSKGILENTSSYRFEWVTEPLTILLDPSSSDQNEGTKAYTAYLIIEKDLQEHPESISLLSSKTLPPGLKNYIEERFSAFLSNERLERIGMGNIQTLIKENTVHLTLDTMLLGEGSKQQQGASEIASITGIIMGMAIYFFLSIYGGIVMQGVMEEKKSKIIEIVISSIRPQELMIGKIIGIGLVGLTQICIWIAILALGTLGLQFYMLGGLYDLSTMTQLGGEFSAVSSMPESAQILVSVLSSVNWTMLAICFLLYFVGGYLVFASLYAGVGSTITSDEQGGMAAIPIMIILLGAFYVGFACFNSPESSLALWASYIPFTSPIVMLSRIAYGGISWGEVFLSLGILYLSFLAITFVVAKIYRIGILMHGKSPNLKEIWQWIRHY